MPPFPSWPVAWAACTRPHCLVLAFSSFFACERTPPPRPPKRTGAVVMSYAAEEWWHLYCRGGGGGGAAHAKGPKA